MLSATLILELIFLFIIQVFENKTPGDPFSSIHYDKRYLKFMFAWNQYIYRENIIFKLIIIKLNCTIKQFDIWVKNGLLNN